MFKLLTKLRNGIKAINEDIFERKLWKLEVAEWLIILIIIAYATIFSFYTIMKFYSFRVGAWDFGILTQSIASATKGNLFINNAERYFSPNGSYFGVHFSPILLITVPFFYLFPKPETIYVMQATILAFGCIPVYFITKHCLNNRLAALLLSGAYLLNPSLQGLNWCDFTPQVFFPLFILSATYFLKKKKPLLLLFFVLLTLMTLEQAAYFVALYAIYCAYELRSDLKNIFNSKRSIFSFIPIIIWIMVFLWAISAANIKSTLAPNPPKEFFALGNYELLGINGIIEIPGRAFQTPELFLKAIQFGLPSKTLYVLLSFAPSGLLALLSPFAVLPSFLWFFLSGLSNWPPYYQLGFQYTAFIVPFVTIATIEGAQKLLRLVDVQFKKNFLHRIPVLLLVIGIILSIFVSPLSFIQKPNDFSYFRDFGVTIPSNLNNEVEKALRIIPNDAFTITTTTLFAHLTTNLNAYVIPTPGSISPELFNSSINYLKSITYEYIIYTSYWDKEASDVLYNEFINSTHNYGLFVNGPGLEIYKLNYNNTPQNIAIKFSPKELFLDQSVAVSDSSSESGNVIKLKGSELIDRTAWFGPYVALASGNYTATFRLKIDQIQNETVLKLDVFSRFSPPELKYLYINGTSFTQPLEWQLFSIDFSVSNRTTELEFRGFPTLGNRTIWLDYIEVIPK